MVGSYEAKLPACCQHMRSVGAGTRNPQFPGYGIDIALHDLVDKYRYLQESTPTKQRNTPMTTQEAQKCWGMVG